jgi:hypothetical protein
MAGRERVLDVKGKIYFAVGAAAGLLTGSRIGRGLYDRVAGAAGTVAGNDTVRKGVSTAGEKAVDAAKSAGGSVGHAAKSAGDEVGHRFAELRKHTAEKHAAEDGAEGYRGVGTGSGTADDGKSTAGRLNRLHHLHRGTTAAVNGTVDSSEFGA